MMNPVSLLLGIAATVLGLACLPMLIMNVAGDCDSMTNLLCCVGFMVLTVVGADNLNKAIGHLFVKK